METGANTVYVGIKGYALALNRETGETLWTTNLAGADFVSLLLDGDRVLAGAKGELFCLDADSGEILWRNGLPGMGWGLISIATANGSTTLAPQQAKRKRDEAAAAGTD
jgi:outer membrane protein assembly factor BamB